MENRLLEQLIICINYDGLLDSDIEDVIKAVRPYFVDEKFSINSGIHKNIDVQLQDPGIINDPVTSTVREIKKYVFERDNIVVNISKSSLDLSVAASLKYEGFETYNKYIMYVYDTILKLFTDIVSIKRIGIRKINSLFIKDIETINKYFVNELINCNSLKNIIPGENNQISIVRNHLTTASKLNKVNIVTEIQTGDAQEIIETEIKTFNVNRVILDIDAYWDIELDIVEDVNEKVGSLNDIVSEIYKNSLNETFYRKLESGFEEPDTNIFGGVK